MDNDLFIPFLVTMLLIYILPSIVAGSRRHPQAAPIIIINLMLGWTLLGYVVALAWSCSAIQRPAPAYNPLTDPDYINNMRNN